MDPRKPTTMMTMTTQTRVVAKTKKPNGSTGMQRTTAGSYEHEYRRFTEADIAKEAIQDAPTITETRSGPRIG